MCRKVNTQIIYSIFGIFWHDHKNLSGDMGKLECVNGCQILI